MVKKENISLFCINLNPTILSSMSLSQEPSAGMSFDSEAHWTSTKTSSINNRFSHLIKQAMEGERIKKNTNPQFFFTVKIVCNLSNSHVPRMFIAPSGTVKRKLTGVKGELIIVYSFPVSSLSSSNHRAGTAVASHKTRGRKKGQRKLKIAKESSTNNSSGIGKKKHKATDAQRSLCF